MWWLSRVEGVSCGHAIPIFAGGNIIEHYVYRFVTVGRACLASNSYRVTKNPVLLLCPSLPSIHLLICREIITRISFRVFITRSRKIGRNLSSIVVPNCREQFPVLPHETLHSDESSATRRTSATCVINDRSLCTFNYRLLRSKC